jgi:hypothetical protein
MKKISVIIAVLILLSPGLVAAETAKELIENWSGFDGGQVTVQGEVIGVMIRENGAWVSIYDNGTAISVWCTAQDARNISFSGDYTHAGDIITVTGTFHVACVEHGGDLDIHADNLTILSTGGVVTRIPNIPLAAVSLALMAVAILLVVLLRRVRKESGKLVSLPRSWVE